MDPVLGELPAALLGVGATALEDLHHAALVRSVA
jgi:hypothetical protein